MHPVGILIDRTQRVAKSVHWGITPTINLRQTEQYVMTCVHLVHEVRLAKQNKQKIYWKGVKIVPVENFLNSKERMTTNAKDAQKENGVLKLVLKRNPSLSIASLGHMVRFTKVRMRNQTALNAAKEYFQ